MRVLSKAEQALSKANAKSNEAALIYKAVETVKFSRFMWPIAWLKSYLLLRSKTRLTVVDKSIK